MITKHSKRHFENKLTNRGNETYKRYIIDLIELNPTEFNFTELNLKELNSTELNPLKLNLINLNRPKLEIKSHNHRSHQKF